jgi:hypothetical protein
MRIHAWSVLCVASFAFGVASGGTPEIGCDGDLDGNLTVDSTDLNLLLADFGANGADLPGDIDRDRDVDSADLNTLLGEFGMCAFDYGPPLDNDEAIQIGLEFIGASGPLVVPTDTYDRIVTDLAAIRDVQSSLANQTHSPAWSPTSLLLAIPDALGLSPVEAHNAYFGVTDTNILFSSGGNTYWVFTFPHPLNIPALSSVYSAIDGVNFAEPDGLIGGQNFYSPEQFPGDTWLWFIDDGFHDCFDGCDCHFYYEFETDGLGGATLIDDSQVGQPWCPWPF